MKKLKKSIQTSELSAGKAKMVELGEVTDVIAGQSPQGKYYNDTGEGIPFYQGKKEFTELYIGKPRVWTTKITQIARKDDILMSVRAPVGPINIATEKICIGRGLASIRANKINQKFLFHFLKSIGDEIKGSGGAVFDSINKRQIEQLKIPLPPLSEQKRIVAKLEKIFKEIDILTTTAKLKQKEMKALRQSILTNELSAGEAKMVELGEVTDVIAGQSPQGKYYNDTSEGIPFYQGKKEFTELYIGKPRVWTTKITQIARKDDILMSVRAPVGPINIATEKICIGRGLASIRANKINQKFLFHFLKSIGDEIKGSGGAVFDSINKRQIEQLKIPLPPLSEQKRIVAKLDKLFAEIDNFVKVTEQKIANYQALKSAILTQEIHQPKLEKAV